MKTWLCSSLLAFPLFLSTAAAQRPAPIDSTRTGRNTGPDLSNVVGAPSGPARIEAEIKVIVPGKGALVDAGWYDIPGKLPAGAKLTAYWKSMPNPVFIRGLGTGLADGSEWTGVIEPDGSYTYRSLLGGIKTVPAFRVSSAPDPAQNTASSAQKPAPWQPRGTALDQRSGR